jgi:hypothetical protein
VGFIDGGFATTNYKNIRWNWNPDFNWEANNNDNISTPIFSTGLALRFNLFGYAVLEPYAAMPFQRNDKDFVFGLFIRGSGW